MRIVGRRIVLRDKRRPSDDEDEFSEAVAIDVFSPEEERVIGLLEAEASPFRDGWETWSPPAAWEIPAFPESWDRLEGSG